MIICKNDMTWYQNASIVLKMFEYKLFIQFMLC